MINHNMNLIVIKEFAMEDIIDVHEDQMSSGNIVYSYLQKFMNVLQCVLLDLLDFLIRSA